MHPATDLDGLAQGRDTFVAFVAVDLHPADALTEELDHGIGAPVVGVPIGHVLVVVNQGPEGGRV
jgi:hypothetical protein